jgi:prepilin-type N-terminal cleavage/methylation domain-containing protein
MTKIQNNKKIPKSYNLYLTTGRAFTLLELLLVIAVVAVLAGIILFALNPAQRLEDANNAQTMAKSEDIRKAIEAYAIANGGSMPTNIASLTTYGLHDICKAGQSTNCLNIDQLVTDGYLGSIPEDKDGSTTVISGYKLEYNPAKNNVQVYNTDSFTEYVEDGATLTTGLVGYWKMDEASWNNNCSTSTVMDSSGNNNHGLSCISGSGLVAGATGIYNKAGDFDGVNDYISVPSNPANSQISMSGWFYIDTFATLWSSVFGNYKISPTANGIDFIPRSGSVMLCAGDGTAYVNGTHCNASFSSAAIKTGSWIHGVFTYDGVTLRAYVNGSLIGSAAKTLDNTNTIFTIGRWDSAHANYYFDGRIDDVRAYNRALSAVEVTALYNYAPPAVAHWKFDEASGTSAQDASGNGNNGTLTNGPTWIGGKYGGAVNFDGVNDLITRANTQIDLSKTFTFSSWIKTSDLSNYHPIFSKYSSYQGEAFIAIYGSDGNMRFECSFTGTSQPGYQGIDWGNSLTGLADNQWHHISYVYDGANIKSYKDGIHQLTSASWTQGCGNTTNAVYLGYFWAGSWSGHMDDTRIYNYALSPIQIQKVMNNEI